MPAAHASGEPSRHTPHVLEPDADAAAIDHINRLLEAFSAAYDIPSPLGGNVKLCLHEMFSNVINHAFDAETRSAARIRIELRRMENGVEVQLEDNGPAFNPLEAGSRGVSGSLEDIEVGGLGIHLVRSTASELRYTRDQDTNRLTMVFRD